jgi:hypothetical protein
MNNIKLNLFFFGYAFVALHIIMYICSISYNMTTIDALIFESLAILDLSVMCIGGYGVSEYILSKPNYGKSGATP